MSGQTSRSSYQKSTEKYCYYHLHTPVQLFTNESQTHDEKELRWLNPPNAGAFEVLPFCRSLASSRVVISSLAPRAPCRCNAFYLFTKTNTHSESAGATLPFFFCPPSPSGERAIPTNFAAAAAGAVVLFICSKT